MLDFDTLLTNDWLYYSIFRYIESISDHCHHASVAIVGLICHSQKDATDQLQQFLDEIHSKINMFLTDEEYQRKNVTLYSEFFPEPIHLDDENMSGSVIEIIETIAQQWNIKHHKQKRQVLKRRLGFMEQDSLLIDYETCSQRFEQRSPSVDEEVENHKLLENEITQMTLDDCLDYLTLTGDIICVGQASQPTILLKPYYLLNDILSRTIFRPRMDQWLNYDENMLFRFSGYYRSEELFNIDRQRLLTRGEFTWKMLSMLFFEQNNASLSLTEQQIIDYCRLMERLYLGFLNESNLSCKRGELLSQNFTSELFRSRIHDNLFRLSLAAARDIVRDELLRVFQISGTNACLRKSATRTSAKDETATTMVRYGQRTGSAREKTDR